MEQIPNKKQEFAKYKELFTKKVDEEALEQIKFIKNTTNEFDKKVSTELAINYKQNLTSQGVILNSDSIKSIRKKFGEFYSENPDAKLFESLNFQDTVKKGDKFCQIKDLKCIFEEKTEALEHKEGMVYLIDFWATWCGPCQRPMVVLLNNYFFLQQHNQEMLEKNQEKWKGKVEIYGVSLDDCKDDVKKRVEAKKWHLVHHYLNSAEENISNYEIDGIPTIYIIDQKGMIVYNGHPMSIDAEQFINKLLEKGTEEMPKKEMLTKEKFKEMKTEIEQFLKTNITKEDKFELNIIFKKKKIFDSKWNVLEKKYKNPILSSLVKIKHNDKLQKILQQLFEKYPKTLFKIKKEQIIDKALQRDNCIKFATSKLTEQGLTKIPTLNLTTSNKFQFTTRQKQGILQKNDKLQFGSTKPYPPTDSEKVKKFNEELQQYKSKAKFKEDVQILNSLYAQSKIAVDDPFYPFKGYKINIPLIAEEKAEEKIEEKTEEKTEEKKEEKTEEKKEEKKKEIVKVEHLPGQVILIDFWATWCPPCQGPMQHNQEMLEKHKEDWGKNVRIVAASLDQDESVVIKRAKEKKWVDIEYVILNEEEFQESPRIYGVRGIPFIVIVNKQGKIKYMGHPSSIKVEEFLQKMLDEEEPKEEEEKKEESKEKGVITEQQFNKLLAIQKEYLPILREKIKDEEFGPNISLKLVKQIKYDLEGKMISEPIYIAKKLALKMYDTQYNKIKEISEFVEKIDQVVKKEDFQKEFNLELEKSISLEFGKECDNCKKALKPTDKQYYCHFHKIWFCYECGNKVDESKKGNSKYLHPCNMVYIHVTNDSGMKNIDEYKFGKNIQYDEDSQVHSYCCNGCSGSGVERYICLTCRPGPLRPGGFVDLCEHCMKILDERNLENDEYKKVHESVMDEKHDEQTHVLLRVLFGKGNYMKF